MASIIKRVRVANPRRRARLTRTKSGRFVKRSVARARTRTRKRNTSPVIRRYPVKTLKAELKRRGVKVSPRRTVRRKTRRVRRSNPVLIELGAINPRRKSVAKRNRRKTRNPRRRRATTVARVQRKRTYRRRRRNPMMTTTVRRRTRINRRTRRRRNPMSFGSGKDLFTKAGGVLVGVAATKFLPTLLPTNISGMVGGLGGFGPVLITGAGAFASYYIANQFARGAFADSVLLGGLSLTLSRAIDMLLPANIAAQISLRGLSDIIPGNYVVPQNPVRPVMMLPAPGNGVSGIGQYRGAYRSR